MGSYWNCGHLNCNSSPFQPLTVFFVFLSPPLLDSLSLSLSVPAPNPSIFLSFADISMCNIQHLWSFVALYKKESIFGDASDHLGSLSFHFSCSHFCFLSCFFCFLLFENPACPHWIRHQFKGAVNHFIHASSVLLILVRFFVVVVACLSYFHLGHFPV